MTIPELAGALAGPTGVQGHPDAIGRFLRKPGFTYKSKEDQELIRGINSPTNRWWRPSDAAHG